MRSSVAKQLAGGEKITKVVIWNHQSHFFTPGEQIKKISYEFVPAIGYYCDGGDVNEDHLMLSEVLRKDVVLEIHTAKGPVWQLKAERWEDLVPKE